MDKSLSRPRDFEGTEHLTRTEVVTSPRDKEEMGLAIPCDQRRPWTCRLHGRSALTFPRWQALERPLPKLRRGVDTARQSQPCCTDLLAEVN
jgi:hypothetical protein